MDCNTGYTQLINFWSYHKFFKFQCTERICIVNYSLEEEKLKWTRLTFTSAWLPEESVLPHFAHFKQALCQSFPMEDTFSAAWEVHKRHNVKWRICKCICRLLGQHTHYSYKQLCSFLLGVAVQPKWRFI